MPPIWRETIINSLYAMFCERVAREGAETLPEMAPLATYIALSPFIGAEAACRIANGGRWPAETRSRR